MCCVVFGKDSDSENSQEVKFVLHENILVYGIFATQSYQPELGPSSQAPYIIASNSYCVFKFYDFSLMIGGVANYLQVGQS